MHYLQYLSGHLGNQLIRYEGWGLLAISFLDSSVLAFPLFNDLALLVLASRHPGRAAIYALQAAVGSVLGAYLVYGITRRGRELLWREATPKEVARAARWLARNDFVALLIASVLPPPLPLKVFVATAGFLQVDEVRFGAAMVVGRGVRFGAIAWLGVHYGPRAEPYLRRNLGWSSLVAVVLVVGLTLLYRRWARPRPVSRGG